ncbi:MAG: formimidoylglutamate deiminase [Pseudomonadota bacterium]
MERPLPDIQARNVLLPTGWMSDQIIRIGDDGRIVEIVPAPNPAAPSIDLLLPAPSNLHSHSFQRAMAGLTETRGPNPKDSFWTWRHLMYRFLDRLTPDHVEAIAALAFVEMLESGFASVAEFHYLHHAPGGAAYTNPAEMAVRIAAAADRTGIGLTLLPVLYMQGGCDGRALEGEQLRFGCDTDRFDALLNASATALRDLPDDTGLGVAPHSLRAVPPPALRHAATLRPDAPVHMHLAEQEAEVDEVERHLGARPVTWLLDNQPPDDRWCLIHCTQMTGAETERLATTGSVAGLCPLTEANLGDGIFNATDFVDEGGRFGVGSDSNTHISLWSELAALEYSQRLRDRTRATLATSEHSTGRRLFDAACQAGAQAAGRRCGGILPGHWADLVAIRTDTPELTARRGDAWLDSLIFGGRGDRHVTDVWCAGRHVVRDGRHVAREDISKSYINALQDLSEVI